MRRMKRRIKIVISKTGGGYIGYPLGIEGVVAGQGKTYEEALEDTRLAIRFHIQTFGKRVLSPDLPVEAFIAEAEVAL